MNNTEATRLAKAINAHKVDGYNGKAHAVPTSTPGDYCVTAYLDYDTKGSNRNVTLWSDPREDAIRDRMAEKLAATPTGEPFVFVMTGNEIRNG